MSPKQGLLRAGEQGAQISVQSDALEFTGDLSTMVLSTAELMKVRGWGQPVENCWGLVQV